MIEKITLIVYMVTAIMTGPNGEKLQPRYERAVFDTLEECQQALAIEEFSRVMAITVQMAYPNYLLDQIGCGAWDMSKTSNGQELPTQFY